MDENLNPFSLSSSPLSSIIPSLSSDKKPKFEYAFEFKDLANTFALKMQPSLSNMQMMTGFATRNSSDSKVATLGRMLLDLVVYGTKPELDNPLKKGSEILPTEGTDIKKGISAKTGNIAAIAGAASDIIGGFLPLKNEYVGPKGDITQTMDSIYDGISNGVMLLGPAGMLAGGIMKGASLLGKGINALGGGTDGMTPVDSILGSSFFNLTPFGLINGIFGKKANTITKDDQAFETVGTSYGGTNYTVDQALTKSGKKYGLFSNAARKRANRLIAEADRQLDIMSDIADETTDRFNIKNAMSAINGNRRAFNMLGGYDQASVRVGKAGLKISPALAREIAKSIKSEVITFQKGGIISDPFEAYVLSLPEALRDSTNFRVRDYWEFNGRPKDFEEAKSKGMFVQDANDNSWHAYTVAENPSTGELEFMKSSTHPTILMELDWYNSDDASDFRNRYELLKTLPYWKYVKRKTPVKLSGGTIKVIPTEIELVTLEEIKEFQQGGTINIIPEGALHARKHNMDIDGITSKGIPVVSEKEGGELELLAEIEKEEIIFRLEVTRKLEELMEEFYDKDSSLSKKDEIALEAGKFLTEEILRNTIDNTKSLL